MYIKPIESTFVPSKERGALPTHTHKETIVDNQDSVIVDSIEFDEERNKNGQQYQGNQEQQKQTASSEQQPLDIKA